MEVRADYKTRFKCQTGKLMAKHPVSVLLTAEVDEFVRSLPNKSDWLREAIAEKYQRQIAKSSNST